MLPPTKPTSVAQLDHIYNTVPKLYETFVLNRDPAARFGSFNSNASRHDELYMRLAADLVFYMCNRLCADVRNNE